MLSNRISVIVLHLLGWILFFSLVIAFLFTSGSKTFSLQYIISGEWLFFAFFYVTVFYLHSSLLIPKLYAVEKYFLYAVAIAVLVTLAYVLKPYDHIVKVSEEPFRSNFPPPPRHGPLIDIVGIVLLLMILSMSLAIYTVKQWKLTERRALQAEADKVNAELSFLKAQINPHFLFNTLNNIYSLTVSNDAKASVAIMKLSEILRYITDEVRNDFVPLQSEIQCITNFIDLQRLRLNEKLTVDYSVRGDIQNKMIAPLILMTFIENVFKYGISSHEQSTISIQIFTETNGINFYCRNKIFNGSKIESTGIGIDNTKKRLEHLYAEKYLLNILNENGFFVVQLTLHN